MKKKTIFDENIEIIRDSLDSIDETVFNRLLDDCLSVLKTGHKIITTGLGKNVPICEKFVGTMLSLGLNAGFLHTNSAVHGDMGMVHSGDLVILLTKSGSTQESVYLEELLAKRSGVMLWLLTFNADGILSKRMKNVLRLSLRHEGDLWNIVPNNSTTVNLIVLQTIAIELARALGLTLNEDFKPNHPGGAIGALLDHA